MFRIKKLFGCLGPAAAAIVSSTAVAGEYLAVFEMSETGHMIVFKMSDKEIAERIPRSAYESEYLERPSFEYDVLLERFELAESGDIIVFQLSAEEVALAKSRRLENLQGTSLGKMKHQSCSDNYVIEMGDGHFIPFASDNEATLANSGGWITEIIYPSAC